MANNKDIGYFKIVMCGESGVGKTNILGRYTRNEFIEDSKSTIGAEFATRTVDYIGENSAGKTVKKQIKLQIWDTAGQERYRAITRSYYRDVAGCMLIYGINSKKSFHGLEKWIEEIRQTSNTEPVLGILGNKCDLEPEKHKVELATAKEFADKHQCAFALETSAKTGQNVEEAFHSLLKSIIAKIPGFLDQDAEAVGPPVKVDGRVTLTNAKPKSTQKCC